LNDEVIYQPIAWCWEILPSGGEKIIKYADTFLLGTIRLVQTYQLPAVSTTFPTNGIENVIAHSGYPTLYIASTQCLH